MSFLLDTNVVSEARQPLGNAKGLSKNNLSSRARDLRLIRCDTWIGYFVTGPWSHAEQRLERACYSWLATTRPDGRPHVTPLWGVWVDGALYLDGLPTTRWARNLAATPSISVHLERGDDVAILEGEVEDLVTDAALGARVVAAWAATNGRLLPAPATQGMFRLRPHTARAWSTATLEDGTRWHFGAA